MVRRVALGSVVSEVCRSTLSGMVFVILLCFWLVRYVLTSVVYICFSFVLMDYI